MSFENIQLPDFLLADLYKECLIEFDNIKTQSEDIAALPSTKSTSSANAAGSPKLLYTGENKKHISIVVNDEEALYLNDPDQQFLTNVLKACQLTPGDIAIVNVAKHPVAYSVLAAELTPAFVLLFGVDPKQIQLPFTVPEFQPQPFAGCTYLAAPALSAINQASAEGKAYKMQLWGNLQKMFPIRK